MGLETSVSTIADLNPLWPLDTDSVALGDNHLRVIKDAVRKTFPSVNAPVTMTDEQLNSIPSLATIALLNAAVASVDAELDFLSGSKLGATANAVSASKLLTTRNIALTGAVTGNVNFDGTANVSITAAIGAVLQTALDAKAAAVHSHAIADVTGLQTALDNRDVSRSQNAATAFSLIAADFDGGKIIETTAVTAVTVTVPPDLAVSQEVTLIQAAAGQVTIAPGTGVTIKSADSLRKTRVVNSVVCLVPCGTNTYWLFGDLA